MKVITDRRNLYATLSVVAIILTGVLLLTQKMETATLCSGLTVVALILRTGKAGCWLRRW